MTETLHTVLEARRRLSLGNTKMYELIGKGEIRTVKIGTRRLVPESAIVEYIAGLMRSGGSAA